MLPDATKVPSLDSDMGLHRRRLHKRRGLAAAICTHARVWADPSITSPEFVGSIFFTEGLNPNILSCYYIVTHFDCEVIDLEVRN